MNRCWCGLMMSLVVVVAAAPGVEAGGVGPEFAIYVDPVPSVSSGSPAVAFNPSREEFLVVWANFRSSTTEDIYARRIAMDGTMLPWFSIVAVAGETHREPAVVYNSVRDEYFLAWEAIWASSDEDIMVTNFAADGSWVGTPWVAVGHSDRQRLPSVAFDPHHDEYVVAYTNVWPADQDVAAQRIDGDGTPLSWATIATAVSPSGYRTWVDVTFDPSTDQYFFAYEAYEGGALTMTRAKLAPFNLAGVSVAPEIDVCVVDDPSSPAVAWGGGHFLVAWNALTAAPWPETRARRISGAGAPLGPAGGFPIGTDPPVAPMSDPEMHSIEWIPDVGFVVAFHQWAGPSCERTYVRVVSPNVDGLLGSFWEVDNHTFPQIACAPWGTCLLVYGGGSGGLLGRILEFRVFGDGFDETGDTSRWTSTFP